MRFTKVGRKLGVVLAGVGLAAGVAACTITDGTDGLVVSTSAASAATWTGGVHFAFGVSNTNPADPNYQVVGQTNTATNQATEVTMLVNPGLSGAVCTMTLAEGSGTAGMSASGQIKTEASTSVILALTLPTPGEGVVNWTLECNTSGGVQNAAGSFQYGFLSPYLTGR